MHLKSVLLLFILLTCYACDEHKDIEEAHLTNWKPRQIKTLPSDSLEYGNSYLSIYSHIYSLTEHTTHNLTATVSIRNTSNIDSLYILKAPYYNTDGVLIRNYTEKPIYVKPMETLEIVISQIDVEGGSGANFIFDWAIKAGTTAPIFEAVMISTSGQQGLSFTTIGTRIE